MKEVVSGLHQITQGGVNAFVLEDDDGLTIIDTGFSKHGDDYAADLASLGHSLSDVANVVITHAHPDHLGNARRFSNQTAPIFLHADGDAIAQAGHIEPTMKPAPGLLNAMLFRILIGSKSEEFPAFTPDRRLSDGDVLDIAGGLEVIHTPGHAASHVALLWKRDRGLLFAGDAAGNVVGLNYSLGYDDFAAGKASLSKLAGRDYEAAVFGHGKPILSAASNRFDTKFGNK